MNKQLDVLKDLNESSNEYQHIILGTYNFEPEFFEGKILPVLRTKDAESIIVLTDKKEYRNRQSEMKEAGTEYYIEDCNVSKIFHPKFLLAVWSEGIKIIIGSANLTKNGWFDNGEIISTLTYFFSEPDTKKEKIISDFRDFLTMIMEKNILKSIKHKSVITKVIEKLPQSKDNTNSEIKLVSNIEKPILEQIQEIIDEPISSVMISAPFFNNEGSVLEFFVKNDCKNFEIFIQPNNVIEFPKEKIEKLSSNGISFKLNKIKFKENESRFIHAKIMIIKTRSNVFCVYGSANPTFSGMLSTFEKGNLELSVINRNSNLGYFDKLIKNESMIIENIGVENIPEREIPNEKESENNIEDKIIDAYLEKNELKLSLETVQNSFEIIFSHNNDDEILKLAVKIEDQKHTIKLNKEQYNFCSKPTFVYFEYLKNDKTIQSDKRWISTQTLELTPRRSDIDLIQKSFGRHNLIKLLNKLKSYSDDSELFFQLLQNVNFGKFGTLETMRSKLSNRKNNNDEDFDYQKISEKGFVLNFENQIDKNMKKINEKLIDIDETKNEEFNQLFNQFLSWSKIIVWMILNKRGKIQWLRFIRRDSEKFTDTVKKLFKNKEFEDNIISKHFWEHVILFCYLIFKLQKKHRYEIKSESEIGVFTETRNKIIEIINEKGYSREFSEMEESLKEYEEFEELDIDITDMERVFREEFGTNFLNNK